MFNLNELSATVGLPLSLEQGAIVVDAILHSHKEVVDVALQISRYVPLYTKLELRYYCATEVVPYYYTVVPKQRTNRLRQRPKQSNGDGVTGCKI